MCRHKEILFIEASTTKCENSEESSSARREYEHLKLEKRKKRELELGRTEGHTKGKGSECGKKRGEENVAME